MANLIDRLFDQVLPRLTRAQTPEWPASSGQPSDEEDTDQESGDINTSNDQVLTLDEGEKLNRGIDRIANERVVGAIGEDDQELLGGGIRHRGMDVLAFYKSRRFLSREPYAGRWGIFYLRPGLSFVEHEILKFYPGYGNPRLLALDFLRSHERFHFYADLQTLLFESVIGRQLYEPIRRALRHRSSLFAEEALANRQVWDWAKKRENGMEEFAYGFMKLQPNAYSRFDENRVELAAEWASVVVDGLPPLTGRRHDLAQWVEAVPKAYLRASLCPEYVVLPANLEHWISPALRLPPVRVIQDAAHVVKLLAGRFASYRADWENTKQKLMTDSRAIGLNLKPWPKDGKNCCSVRVDQNFRAHIKHLGSGLWEAYSIGPHTSLGHG